VIIIAWLMVCFFEGAAGKLLRALVYDYIFTG
jgi:hypothetical protein